MKRVLIFSTAYFPHVGGAEVAIKEITERLTPEYEFDLICARYSKLPAQERVGVVNVYRVGWGIRLLDKLIAPLWGAFLALSLDRKQHYTVYWAMMVTYGSGGAYIANLLRFWKSTPIILTLQEGDSMEYLRTKWLGLLGLSWRLALSYSSAVTVISSYLAEVARSFGYKGNSVLVPNGVDSERFSVQHSDEECAHMKKNLGKKEGDVFVVTTSRLVHKNAVDDGIRALTYLPENVSFLIYGSGPDEDTLKALARKLGVEKRARFMGHIGHEEMPLMLSACDIFLRPSRSEGMGNSFIEAMAAGLPVVATQEGGIADFLYDAKRDRDKETTGWAVDKDSPEQIAKAIQDIMKNPEVVKKVTHTARALIREKYDWGLVAHQMKSVLDRTLLSR